MGKSNIFHQTNCRPCPGSCGSLQSSPYQALCKAPLPQASTAGASYGQKSSAVSPSVRGSKTAIVALPLTSAIFHRGGRHWNRLQLMSLWNGNRKSKRVQLLIIGQRGFEFENLQPSSPCEPCRRPRPFFIQAASSLSIKQPLPLRHPGGLYYYGHDVLIIVERRMTAASCKSAVNCV